MDELNVILYSTRCPQCKMLEMLLDKKKIPVSIIYGEEHIRKLGYQSAPIMSVNDRIMTFAEAVRWANNYGGDADGN